MGIPFKHWFEVRGSGFVDLGIPSGSRCGVRGVGATSGRPPAEHVTISYMKGVVFI